MGEDNFLILKLLTGIRNPSAVVIDKTILCDLLYITDGEHSMTNHCRRFRKNEVRTGTINVGNCGFLRCLKASYVPYLYHTLMTNNSHLS